MSTNDQQPATIAVRLLEARDSHDAQLVDHLTSLINDVYTTAESGLWRDGAPRTTAAGTDRGRHPGRPGRRQRPGSRRRG